MYVQKKQVFNFYLKKNKDIAFRQKKVNTHLLQIDVQFDSTLKIEDSIQYKR